ncbi:hypothetical protein AX768_07320 [Burkholderia sp. PAMC 28687]|nr:hypothetical protein AXG89_34020 [Burkholderia sp. PAMC 26561]AMM13939.1 hypothetical protein AX768_07320 [Burkholderia sp. PAMC 28687]
MNQSEQHKYVQNYCNRKCKKADEGLCSQGMAYVKTLFPHFAEPSGRKIMLDLVPFCEIVF